MGSEENGKIKWIDNLSNEKAMNKAKEKRTFLNTIQKKKGNWIRHMRENNINNCYLGYSEERKEKRKEKRKREKGRGWLVTLRE